MKATKRINPFIILQINGVLSVRLLNDENSSRQPSQTKVVAADDSQRFVGSIINPQGFSKDGKVTFLF